MAARLIVSLSVSCIGVRKWQRAGQLGSNNGKVAQEPSSRVAMRDQASNRVKREDLIPWYVRGASTMEVVGRGSGHGLNQHTPLGKFAPNIKKL